MWIGDIDRVYEVYKWCMRLNDNENKICWMRDYQRWHTIHIQIIMIRYRMRCAVDGLSWWIWNRSTITIISIHSHTNGNIQTNAMNPLVYHTIYVYKLSSKDMCSSVEWIYQENQHLIHYQSINHTWTMQFIHFTKCIVISHLNSFCCEWWNI